MHIDFVMCKNLKVLKSTNTYSMKQNLCQLNSMGETLPFGYKFGTLLRLKNNKRTPKCQVFFYSTLKVGSNWRAGEPFGFFKDPLLQNIVVINLLNSFRDDDQR